MATNIAVLRLGMITFAALTACTGGRRIAAPVDGATPSELGPAADAAPPIDLGALSDAGSPIDLGPLADLGPVRDAGPSFDLGAPRDGGTDSGTPLAVCQHSCDGSAASCATASAAFDADNYSCRSGVCEYTGCNSDAECQSSFSDVDYVCSTASTPHTCVLGCLVAADCATASAAFDTDNYACTGGRCAYLGCRSEAECESSFSDARYVCGGAGASVPTCALGCATAADCATASAAFDADNYACRGGVCAYIGCRSDAECSSSFASPSYVCR